MLNGSTMKSSHDAEVQSSGLEGRLLVLPQDSKENTTSKSGGQPSEMHSTLLYLKNSD